MKDKLLTKLEDTTTGFYTFFYENQMENVEFNLQVIFHLTPEDCRVTMDRNIAVGVFFKS